MPSHLNTDKRVGELVYYRQMESYFEPVNRSDDFVPAVIWSVELNEKFVLREPGMRGLQRPMWTARWVDCFSGRDLLHRADRYCENMRLENAKPGGLPLYNWYQSANYEIFDILVNRPLLWEELTELSSVVVETE